MPSARCAGRARSGSCAWRCPAVPSRSSRAALSRGASASRRSPTRRARRRCSSSCPTVACSGAPTRCPSSSGASAGSAGSPRSSRSPAPARSPDACTRGSRRIACGSPARRRADDARLPAGPDGHPPAPPSLLSADRRRRPRAHPGHRPRARRRQPPQLDRRRHEVVTLFLTFLLAVIPSGVLALAWRERLGDVGRQARAFVWFLTDRDAQGGLLPSLFIVACSLVCPVAGWLGDRQPRLCLAALGVFVWSAATVASGLAPTYALLLVARAVIGAGEASYSVVTPSLLSDCYPAERRARALGIFYAAIPVGSALGYILGGVVGEAYGWRATFFIAGAPGAAPTSSSRAGPSRRRSASRSSRSWRRGPSSSGPRCSSRSSSSSSISAPSTPRWPTSCPPSFAPAASR